MQLSGSRPLSREAAAAKISVHRVPLRLRLTVAYDGRGFHGFAPQSADVPTVGGALVEAVERVLRVSGIVLSMGGRTDTGVHAWGQVVSFDIDAGPGGVDLERLRRSVNSQLGPRVVVREACEVPPDFSARHSAVARRYRYTVLNRPVPDPFLAATSWHVETPLDLGALRLSCDPLIGEHDFTSFCREPKGVPHYSMVRRVTDARWHDLGDGVLRFDIEASSFCQQMVRSVVGTMVAMGSGRLTAGEMTGILRAKVRAAGGRVAPPHGLCLWEIVYPPATPPSRFLRE